MKTIFRAAIAAVVMVALTACGGGGGGGGGGAGTQSAMIELPPEPGTGTLAGKVTYDYVPNVAGVLRYDQTEPRPIRGATLEVVEFGTQKVLATSKTDHAGGYAVPVAPGQRVVVRVKAQIVSPDGISPGWDVQVRDNTDANKLYALESESFDSGTGAQSLHARSGWDGSVAGYSEPRSAAPFAVLDTIAKSQTAILGVAPHTQFPPLTVYWSPDNRPATGNRAAGEIGLSHFRRDGNGYAIYILGREGSDTDEYDESVVAHEWGHYYQAVFSRDDSLGGMHGGNRPLEMSVAFSEGWGAAWQGLALGRSDYADSYGPRQAQAMVVMPLDQGPDKGRGWYSEESVAHVLWALGRQAGVAGIHQAMRALRQSPAFTSIHAFASALRQQAPGTADVLDTLLKTQDIVPSAGSDAFGAGETNDGGLGLLAEVNPRYAGLPLYLPVPLDQVVEVCTTSTHGARNRHGLHRALRFDPPQAGRYRLGIATAANSTPYMTMLWSGARETPPFDTHQVVLEGQLPAQPLVFTLSDSRTWAGLDLHGCVAIKIVRVTDPQIQSQQSATF